MRTQENKEKYREYDHKYYIKNKRPKTKIGQLESEINQLKQQLAEKDKELQEVMSNIVGLARGRELIILDKIKRFIDSEIEIPNDIGAIKLTQFFEEEIQRIKTGETYINWKQSQTQLAIQELKKLRNDIWELDIGDYYLQNGGTIENIKVKRKDVCDLIDNHIKELKGE